LFDFSSVPGHSLRESPFHAAAFKYHKKEQKGEIKSKKDSGLDYVISASDYSVPDLFVSWFVRAWASDW